MRFFEHQQRARAETRQLLMLFAATVTALVLTLNVALALTWNLLTPGRALATRLNMHLAGRHQVAPSVFIRRYHTCCWRTQGALAHNEGAPTRPGVLF